jgi:hypothetical protein
VHHHQRALALRDAHDLEKLVILKLPLRVGHVDLERSDAALDRRGQLVLQDLVGRIADDQVEAVVDDGLAARALVVVGDRRRDRRAAVLGGERDDGGCAAERCGHRAAVEVVGGHDSHAGELLDVAMAVDAAGKHVAALGVDVAPARRQLLRHGNDLLALDTDVAAHGLGRGRYGAVANRQVH